MPLTTRVVIDEDEYLRLIDQMRISVPQEIKNARQLEAERDQVLAGLAALGCPVIPWRGPGTLDGVLRRLARRAGAPRAVAR